jgi:hypothetical protein
MSSHPADIGTIMDKHINFEDNIYIINVRIRMLLDLLCLDADPGLFMEKTIDDLDFIDQVLSSLLETMSENRRFVDREDELDKLADLEWRFDQLLTGTGSRFPLVRERLTLFRSNSAARRQSIDETRSPDEQLIAEPVVSSYELNELLREL